VTVRQKNSVGAEGERQVRYLRTNHSRAPGVPRRPAEVHFRTNEAEADGSAGLRSSPLGPSPCFVLHQSLGAQPN
jgi:hypothetical protein